MCGWLVPIHCSMVLQEVKVTLRKDVDFDQLMTDHSYFHFLYLNFSSREGVILEAVVSQ